MRKESSNQFTEGLVSDLNPINTPNTVLTDALNATIITYNGNEFSLQNDMGNYPLENCKLKPNYIPVGLKEHGDILYIVSYNPLTNHVEVGSYPSPLQVNAVDSEDYELEFGSILDDHLGIVAKYSELVKEETYIVFNGEDYKLYPGDAYKIDVEEEKYAYETFEYYILDDNSILHNVTEEVKKNINKEEYEHVSWLIPGYIAAKVRLARLSTSGLNVRSFYAPLKGNDERDVYFDFNIKVNIDDDLINNRLNSVSEYKNDLTFKVTIDNKRGNLKTDVLENPNLSEWYLDKNILWIQYKGELTTNKDDVLTVSVTPILTEKKDNEVLYSIAYDGLIQPQEFDLSRVNDKPFGIDDDFYKFYQTNDKEQVIEINVSGPAVTTSQVDLHYNIYTLEKQNKPAKTDKFDNYFGIGYNRLTIPFDDVFKKENIYTIEFVFKGDIEFTSSRRLLITTELLNGSERANAYDRDLTMDDLVKKYFDRVSIDLNYTVQNISSSQNLTINADEVTKEYLNTNNNFNTFVKSSEDFVDIKADVGFSIKSKIDLNVNVDSLETETNMWSGISETSLYFEDVDGEREFAETIDRFVYKTISGTPKKYDTITYAPVKGYRVYDYLRRYSVRREIEIGSDPTSWTDLDFGIIQNYSTFDTNKFGKPSASSEGMPFYYMKLEHPFLHTLTTVMPVDYLVLPSKHCIALSELGLGLQERGWLNNIYLVFDNAYFEDYDSWYTNLTFSEWISKFTINCKCKYKHLQIPSIDNVLYDSCLHISKLDWGCEKSVKFEESVVNNDFDDDINKISSCVNQLTSQKQFETWKENPVYRDRNLRGTTTGVYLYTKIGNDKTDILIKALDKSLLNSINNDTIWSLEESDVQDLFTNDLSANFRDFVFGDNGYEETQYSSTILRQLGFFNEYNETLS